MRSTLFNQFRRWNCVLAVACLAAIAQAQPTTRPSVTPPKVGDHARDFSLNTLDGKTITLSKLDKTGPVVLIELRGWVGYQCPICTRQVGDLIAHKKPILKTGAHVVLVYPGSAKGLKQHAEDFIAGKGLPAGYFFVTDPGMHFVNRWGIPWHKRAETAYPSTFIIDQNGIVQFAKISHSHGDRASAAQILKVLNHQ